MSKRLVLTLTDEIYASVEDSAKKLGIPPLEYIRYLITKDKERKDANAK